MTVTPETQKKITLNPKLVHFSMFAFMWAVALLWHYLRRPADYAELYLLLIPAVFVLARPRVGIFLIAMCFGFFFTFSHSMPFSTRVNHPPAEFLINVLIIVSAAWVLVRNYMITRRWELDHEAWFDIFRPFIITCVNIVYLMAVFNKLNTDFFNIHYSPVTELMNMYYQSSHLLFIPDMLPRADWVLHVAIISTLVIETAVPLMLWIRPLRLWGIALGVVFHVIVSIRGYPPMAEFPTVLFAIYILALPDSTIPMLQKLWNRIMSLPWIKTIFTGGVAVAAWFFFLLPNVLQWPQKSDKLYFGTNEIWSYAWVIYILFYVVILSYLLWRTRGGFREPADMRFIKPRLAVFYIFPIIVILNGLTPYFGLKNKGSWNMYSHLRTEGSYSNHLFMPNIRLFPFMDEICIVNTTDEELKKIERNKRLLMETDFVAWARKNPEASIEFYYNGELIQAERIGDYEQFMRPRTVWEELFWLVDDDGGLSYLDWCQQYIPNDVIGPVLYLDHSYVLWDENAVNTGGSSEEE